METFVRGLEPKVAMNIGEISYCKKEYSNGLCFKCRYAVYSWCPNSSLSDYSNRNYCKLGYWGLPEK